MGNVQCNSRRACEVPARKRHSPRPCPTRAKIKDRLAQSAIRSRTGEETRHKLLPPTSCDPLIGATARNPKPASLPMPARSTKHDVVVRWHHRHRYGGEHWTDRRANKAQCPWLFPRTTGGTSVTRRSRNGTGGAVACCSPTADDETAAQGSARCPSISV